MSRQNLDAEPLGLPPQAAGELFACHTVWKAREIVEPLGYARLASDATPFDHERVDALTSGVEPGGESRRSAPDDDQVVEASRRRRLESETGRQLRVRRFDECGTVAEDDHRYHTLAVVDPLDE